MSICIPTRRSPHRTSITGPSAIWDLRCGYHSTGYGRFADVRAVLLDHETFSSARGVAAADEVNAISTGSTLKTDPPEHDKLRKILGSPLTRPALRKISPGMQAEANALVERLCAQGSFDAIHDLATHLPLTVVS